MKNIKQTNRSYIYLIVLLFVVIFYIVSEPFKSFSSEIIMLFTSMSSESITGYLNSYDIVRPLVSIALMIFQALIFPFKYEIVIFANIKVFGELMGFVLSFVGRIIGAYICYDLGRSLLSKRIELITKRVDIKGNRSNYIKNSVLVNILIRILPLNFNLISYFAGIMQLNSKKYMINSIIWATLTTLVYSIKKGYYSHSYEMRMILIRLILSILVFVIIAKRYHKDIGRV